MITELTMDVANKTLEVVTEINMQCNTILTIALIRRDRETREAVLKILDANQKLIKSIKGESNE